MIGTVSALTAAGLALLHATPAQAVFASKRGLDWPSDNHFDPKVFAGYGTVDFIYNWNTKPQTGFGAIPNYYAMQWNGNGITNLAAAVQASGAKYVLGFNEPDNGGQANMSPQTAASLWKQYIQPLRQSNPGVKLITPAVTNAGAPGGLAWMDSFLAACTGCTFDGAAIHWYGGWTGDFVAFIQGAFKYNLPLYLTEFGLDWDQYATVDSFKQFLPLAMCYLDNTPQIAKYAFFGAFYSNTAKDLLTSSGQLSALGQLYVSYNAQGCDVGATTGGGSTTAAPPTSTTTTKPPTSTAGATYVGCYVDAGNPRTLSSYSTSSGSMTNAVCQSTCFGLGYTLAGTEYASECYCGNSLSGAALDSNDGNCNAACAGDSSKKCGGSLRLSVYKAGSGGSTPPPPTTTATSPGGTGAYVGCYTDGGSPRSLSGYSTSSGSMTNPSCQSTCKSQGYAYAGTEYSSECYCGNSLGGSLAAEADCNGACAGDNSKKCGGSFRLSVWKTS